MLQRLRTLSCPLLAAAIALTSFAVAVRADEADPRVTGLIEENRKLSAQLREQQNTIEALNVKMAELLRATQQQAESLRALQDQVAAPSGAPTSDRSHEVRVAGETGLAFFSTGSRGPFPNSEFRVDDAVISVEAPVWQNTYFFGEMKLLTRESNTEAFQMGEFYVDFENVSKLWGQPDLLSFRAGRINTPFGEEYQRRTPVTNPLISHSLSDIWGTDEGMEIYGTVGPAHYVLAVQNGGASQLHDYNADKAIVARVGWDPVAWLHLSGSAMRTGKLSAANDTLSDLWFGNGFFRSIFWAPTTTTFWADLAEGDVVIRWPSGRASAAYGVARYDDNDTVADNRRRIRYGYLELVQTIADRLYGAVRYSGIEAPHGYPIVGAGTPGEYFFRPSLTESLRRLSLGFGYRFSDPLVLKLEYSWNSGHLANGQSRQDEDFFGTEIALKF